MMKNKILRATTYAMAAIFIFSACALDSTDNLPAVLCTVSLMWLALFVVANQERMIGGKNGV